MKRHANPPHGRVLGFHTRRPIDTTVALSPRVLPVPPHLQPFQEIWEMGYEQSFAMLLTMAEQMLVTFRRPA